MNNAQTDEPTPQKPLRLWPGVALAVLQCLIWFAVPNVMPDNAMFGMLGAFLCGLAIVVWWAFFSRAPRSERWGAVVLMIVAVLGSSRLLHESVANAGMGMMFIFYSIPALSLALVAWAVVSRRLSSGPRRASMVAAFVLTCGAFTLVRTSGITGAGASDLQWRWTPTPEERLLAQAGDRPATLASPPAAKTSVEPPAALGSAKTAMSSSAPPAVKAREKRRKSKAVDEPATIPPAPPVPPAKVDWPGFRGPARDGIIPGVRIATDWVKSPPVELWRRPVGPGWSSFAISGVLLYTQEQRGEEEVVSCYKLTTGEPVWRHGDAVRFWESNGGAGPRATPTLSNGRVYAFGATGVLNALDAANGAVVWSRNAASDTGAKLPGWGFSSSPLVVGDLVIVAASGRLAAYDVATGKSRWLGPAHGGSYSSPHLATIGGVKQILLMSGAGATSVAPANGTLLWEHAWQGSTIVQPALTANGDVLIAVGDAMGGIGMRRISVAHRPAGWTAEERWTSRGLKPYFNDFVVHNGHAFGFDGSILACIDLEGGERKWKGGRYGHGQLLLLPDQDLLLVLSEMGELVLVAAAPDQFAELARFPAIKGKTWNHPVLVGDVLLVRNDQEMVAFRLSLADR